MTPPDGTRSTPRASGVPAIDRVLKSPRAQRFARDWWQILLGAVIGSLTGLGAVGFIKLLHAAEHWSSHAQTKMSIWLLPLIPMGGALITGLLVTLFASDARGHGVPQVIDAIARKSGFIPLRVGLTKVLASIATVGSGGSGGAEGPIVQIGATSGSVIGRGLGLSKEHLGTMVGCGAAAGIASVFNAPIAGVLFTLEILLRDFSLRTFTPIVVACVCSTAVTQLTLGANEAIFGKGLAGYTFTALELPSFFVLGLVCALVGVGFTRLLHFGEDKFEKVKVHPIVKPVIGALMLGVLGILFVLVTQREAPADVVPAFFGNGYDSITWLIQPATYLHGTPHEGLRLAIWTVALLMVCKAIATTFTLATGGSGGVFAPSMFVGAATGAAFGLSLAALGLIPGHASPAGYALVGMGALIASTTFAPLTAILLLFELTREPLVLLPIMIAAIPATVLAQWLMGESIYTFRLRQAGVLLSAGRDLTVMRRVRVASCALEPLPKEGIHPGDPLSKLIMLHAHHHGPDFAITDQSTGALLGMVTGSDIRTALIDREAIPLLLVAELMRTDLPRVSRDETLDVVLDKFARHDVASLPIMSPIDPTLPVGLITRSNVMVRYREALEES
ncbi:MAG: chloride channel protein [Phycisphaerales bacterium]|jgi:CIC family chloride channel protein|nr:chloride channel protein [Phycisphaerales bacterium]